MVCIVFGTRNDLYAERNAIIAALLARKWQNVWDCIMVKNRLNSYAKYAFLNAYPLNDDPTKTIFYKAGYSFFALNFVVKTNFHQTMTVIRTKNVWFSYQKFSSKIDVITVKVRRMFSHIFSKLKITYPTISITYLRMGGLKEYSCIYVMMVMVIWGITNNRMKTFIKCLWCE